MLSRSRTLSLVSVLAITPVGLYTKFYGGVGAEWVSDSLGGVLYEIFWCLVVVVVIPRARAVLVAGCVLLATSALEVLQLWHPQFLEWLRSSFAGAALLGTSFDAWDFLYYLLGCVIGWFWITILQRHCSADQRA